MASGLPLAAPYHQYVDVFEVLLVIRLLPLIYPGRRFVISKLALDIGALKKAAIVATTSATLPTSVIHPHRASQLVPPCSIRRNAGVTTAQGLWNAPGPGRVTTTRFVPKIRPSS